MVYKPLYNFMNNKQRILNTFGLPDPPFIFENKQFDHENDFLIAT